MYFFYSIALNINSPEIKVIKNKNNLSISSIAFSKGGHLISSASKVGDEKTLGEITCWDIQADQVKWSVKSMNVDNIVLSSNGQHIASGGKMLISAGSVKDGEIKIWDTQTGALLREWVTYGHPVTSMLFSADNKALISGGSDGSVKIWEVKSGQLLRVIDVAKSPVSDIAISTDETMMVCVSGADALIYDLKKGKLLRKNSNHKRKVNSVDLSRYKIIATGGFDEKVVLWDARKNLLLHALRSNKRGAVTKVVFSPDGSTIVSGHVGRTIIAWDVKTGKIIRFIDKNSGGRIKALTFSFDGKKLASSDGAEIKIWSSKEGFGKR